jgi:hypothetical protein
MAIGGVRGDWERPRRWRAIDGHLTKMIIRGVTP